MLLFAPDSTSLFYKTECILMDEFRWDKNRQIAMLTRVWWLTNWRATDSSSQCHTTKPLYTEALTWFPAQFGGSTVVALHIMLQNISPSHRHGGGKSASWHYYDGFYHCSPLHLNGRNHLEKKNREECCTAIIIF